MNKKLVSVITGLVVLAGLVVVLIGIGTATTDRNARTPETEQSPGTPAPDKPVKENEYDDNGNLVVEYDYGEDGKLDRRIEYKYDNGGNKVAATSFEMNSLEVVYLIIRTRYDNRGNQTSRSEYLDDRLIKRDDKRYDDEGNVIEGWTYGVDGRLRSRYEQTYDKDNNLINIKRYDGDNKPVTETWFDSGSGEISIKYIYDDQGNRVVHHKYDGKYEDPGECPLTMELQRDDEGNLITESFYSKGLEVFACIYDDEGNLIDHYYEFTDNPSG